LKKFRVEEDQLKTFYAKHYEQLEKQWEEVVERVTNSVINILDDCKAVDNLPLILVPYLFAVIC